MLNRRLCVKRAIALRGSRAVVAAIVLLLFAATVPAWPPGGNGGGGSGKPPKDPPQNLIPVKIILMAGQSNMGGNGLNEDLHNLAPELIQPRTDIGLYRGTQPQSSIGIWRDLQPGLGTGTLLSDRFGPELTFGRDLVEGRPDDNFMLIKTRGAGTSLALDWDPITPGPSWVVFVNTVNNALAAIDPDVFDPEIVGMIWMQGGRDAKDEQMALAYEENLTNFIQAVRTQFGKPNLPFILEQLTSINTTQRPFLSVVAQAQFDVWTNTPNTGLVNTGDVSTWPGSTHFDSAGQLVVGTRFASEMLAVPVVVDSVDYSLSGGKKPTLTVTISIVDEMGPVSGAAVSAILEHESGSFSDASGTTDSDGTVSFRLKNAKVGCYMTTVIDVNAGIFDWDGSTPVNLFCK